MSKVVKKINKVDDVTSVVATASVVVVVAVAVGGVGGVLAVFAAAAAVVVVVVSIVAAAVADGVSAFMVKRLKKKQRRLVKDITGQDQERDTPDTEVTEQVIQTPPKNAEWLAVFFLKDEFPQGDLAELYYGWVEDFGKKRADILYWKEVLTSVGPFLGAKAREAVGNKRVGKVLKALGVYEIIKSIFFG